MEISSNLSNTGIEGADKFEKMIEDIALTVKSGNIGGNSGNRRSGRVCRWIIFSNSISFRRRCVVDPTGGSIGINEIINKKGKLENVYKIQADR